MNRKKIIIMLLVLTMIVIVGKETYAYYFSRTNVSVKADSSNVICDAAIGEVSQAEKGKLGYSEFKVTVKNYDTSDNVSKEPFSYTLTVENNNGNNGVFGYNNNFDSGVSITDTMTNSGKTDRDYIIQVKTSDGLGENVGYKVKLKCTQSN